MSSPASPKITGLTKRAVAGTGWSTIATVGKQLLTIASVTTVARKLGPSAYGLMGMATIVTGFISNFRDLGTAGAIVQRPTINRALLSSLFWLNATLGLLCCLVVFAGAPAAGQFFKTPELPAILRALSLSLLLASLGVVHNAILTRDMAFKAIAITDLLAALASYLVALTGALTGLGVWSLVFASVVGSLVTTVSYWATARFRPRIEFDWAEVRSIAKFSSNLSGFGFVNYLYRTSDNVIVSKRLGSVPLGYYQMAYNLMLTPIQNISSVIAQVLFPAFARIQDDNERFRNTYVRACMLTALLTFPVLAGMGVVADPLIRAVLGPKWIGTIPIFQILAPVGLVQSIHTTTGIIYQAKGRTDRMFRWSLVVLATCVTAFLIGVQFGATGVAAGYAVAFIGFLTVPGFIIPFRLIRLRFADFAKALLPQLAITAAMVMACIAWLLAMPSLGVTNDWERLVTTCLLGAAVYCGLLLLLRPPVLNILGDVISSSDHRLVSAVTGRLRQMRVVR